MKIKYAEIKYKKYVDAKNKQKEMKRDYGYTPTVFKLIHPINKKVTYVVIKPKGIKKLN